MTVVAFSCVDMAMYKDVVEIYIVDRPESPVAKMVDCVFNCVVPVPVKVLRAMY